MRRFIAAVALLAACNGDKESPTDEDCDEVTVTITVTDEAGTAVTGATVEVGDATCSEGADGVYTCVVPLGDPVMSVVKTPDFNPYAETLLLDGALCEYPVTVVLPPPLVY